MEEKKEELKEERFEGVEIRIGERKCIVPALNMFRLKKLLPMIMELQKIQKGKILSEEDAEKTVTIIHSALSRNYPSLTEEQISEMVDMNNMNEIMQAIMGVSGLRKVVAGEKLAGNP